MSVVLECRASLGSARFLDGCCRHRPGGGHHVGPPGLVGTFAAACALLEVEQEQEEGEEVEAQKSEAALGNLSRALPPSVVHLSLGASEARLTCTARRANCGHITRSINR